MRRRGFREVRGEVRDAGYYGERPNNNYDPQIDNVDGYKQIKPESSITFEEAQNFWDNLFAHKIDELPDEL